MKKAAPQFDAAFFVSLCLCGSHNPQYTERISIHTPSARNRLKTPPFSYGTILATFLTK